MLTESRFKTLGRSVRIAHNGSSYGLSLVEGFKTAAAQVGLTLEREWSVPPSGPDYEGRLSVFGQQARSDTPESIVFVAASEGPAVKLIQALRDWLSQFNSPQRSFSGTTGRIRRTCRPLAISS
ncbi:MAG: hypothetical protein WCJ64_13480 [Rhodospirillaceae bacterium]